MNKSTAKAVRKAGGPSKNPPMRATTGPVKSGNHVVRVPRDDDMERWQAESDMRALMNADEIRRDKGRMAKAKNHAMTMAERIKGVCK